MKTNHIFYVQLPNGETKTFYGMIGANHGPNARWVHWKWCFMASGTMVTEPDLHIIFSYKFNEQYKRVLPANWRLA